MHHVSQFAPIYSLSKKQKNPQINLVQVQMWLAMSLHGNQIKMVVLRMAQDRPKENGETAGIL